MRRTMDQMEEAMDQAEPPEDPADQAEPPEDPADQAEPPEDPADQEGDAEGPCGSGRGRRGTGGSGKGRRRPNIEEMFDLSNSNVGTGPQKYAGRQKSIIPQTEANEKDEEDVDTHYVPFTDFKEYTKGQVMPRQQVWDIPSSSEDEDEDSPPVWYRRAHFYPVPSHDTIGSSITEEEDNEATPMEIVLDEPGPSNREPGSPIRSQAESSGRGQIAPDSEK